MFFCLTVSKSFVGEHVCVSEIFGYREILWITEEGRVSRIFVKVCVSQSRKISYDNPYLFQTKPASEKTYGQ